MAGLTKRIEFTVVGVEEKERVRRGRRYKKHNGECRVHGSEGQTSRSLERLDRGRVKVGLAAPGALYKESQDSVFVHHGSIRITDRRLGMRSALCWLGKQCSIIPHGEWVPPGVEVWMFREPSNCPDRRIVWKLA